MRGHKKSNFKNGLKKLLSLLLIVCTCIIYEPFLTSANSENPYKVKVGSVDFSVSATFCATGEKAKIFVDIGANSQMSAALFTLKFDTTRIRATSVDIGLVLKNGYTSKNITSEGEVKVSFSDINPNYEAGRLFEVEFEAIGELGEEQFRDVPVTLEVTDICNYEGYPLSANITNGKITIINTPYGDVNQSGDVTAADALMALYSNSQLIELTKEQKVLADVNGDGKVTAADALQILQFSAGYISNYGIFQLGTPKNLVVSEKEETYLRVNWDIVPNATGYNVFVNGIKKNAEVITNNEYLLNDLTEGSKYNVTVEAVNVLTASPKSEILTASTNKAEHTVIFKDWDGTILDTQIVGTKNPAKEPNLPERKGYNFSGWDKDFSHITEDMVVTAQYTAIPYKVDLVWNPELLNPGNGRWNQTDTVTAAYGTHINQPVLLDYIKNNRMKGYTLEGWYLDKNYIKKWDFKKDVVEGSMTLYAKWVTWSEWTTDTSLLNNEAYEVEERNETRYRSKTTTTSTSNWLAGWTRYDTQLTGWGNWSAWQNSVVYASDSRQVQTQNIPAKYKTQYYYDRYTTSSGNWTSWGYGTFSGYACTVHQETGWLDYALGVVKYVDGRPQYGPFGTSNKNYWYNQQTRQIQTAAAYTQWRYRDAIYTYYYYKWSDWSDWEPAKIYGIDGIEVQTRTVYRYKLKQE